MYGAPEQIAKAYRVHPNSVGLWKHRFIERARETFAEETTVHEYGRRIRDPAQLLGKKELKITLLRNFLSRTVKAKMALVGGVRETHGLVTTLPAVGLAHWTWYHTLTRVRYSEKYAHL